MTKRFTFAVCLSCGVQSQPIIFDADEGFDVSIPLAAIGWQHNTCPGCLKLKKENEKKTVKA